jgi:GNAT superfamily N-acetyltransferase
MHAGNADRPLTDPWSTSLSPFGPIGSLRLESMPGNPLDISRAERFRLGSLAPMFARAFRDDPMMRWSLVGAQEPEEVLHQCFTYFLERALDLGMVWSSADAHGAAVWMPPGIGDGWEEHPWSQPRILELSEDGGGRYESFWEWIESHIPEEPLWLLDSIAVDPQVQGRGYGRALIESGQSLAALAGRGAFLSTGTHGNVAIYQKCGFRIVDHVDAPDGGPHVWFMRWDA